MFYTEEKECARLSSVIKFKNSMVHYNNNLLLILFSFFFSGKLKALIYINPF